MSLIAVRPTSLDSASFELNSSRASLDSARGGLTDTGSVAAATGSAEAGAAFEHMIAAWTAAFDRLSGSLDAFAQNTAAAAAVYEQTDLQAVPESLPPECPPEGPDPLGLGPDCVVYG